MESQAYQAWKATQDSRDQASKKIDWATLDVKPSDISYELGPALTEEQFKDYCESKGIKPKVIKNKK